MAIAAHIVLQFGPASESDTLCSCDFVCEGKDLSWGFQLDPFCSQLSVTDAITNPRVFSGPVCLKAIVPTHTYIQSYYSVDKGNVWIILHMLSLLLCFLFFLFG